MGRAEQKAKDSAMAASLLRSSTHSAKGVAAYKRGRFANFMAALKPGVIGSAAYRRRKN